MSANDAAGCIALCWNQAQLRGLSSGVIGWPRNAFPPLQPAAVPSGSLFGVSATAVLVVLLVKLGLPINGGLVLTGSLLRFLPGAALVSGMHDFIDGAYVSGTARLVEVVLLGAAIAGAASLILALGVNLDVRLQITSSGRVEWPALVLVASGAAAVACYALRLGVPSRALLSAAALGGVAVTLVRGMTPVSAELSQPARTLVAALVIGVVGRWLAQRAGAPAPLWMVPSILPLLPAPSTLLPLLAETDAARDALQGQAIETAFTIGVGVASGSIILLAVQRYRGRLILPVAGAVTTGLAARVGRSVSGWARRQRHRTDPTKATDTESDQPT